MTINRLLKSLNSLRNYFFLTAVLILSFSLNINAQKLDYETDSGFDFGFGIGASYQHSDVRNSRGTGIDFRFGHSIYKRPYSFFALDWRLRFLIGENEAYDDRINIDGTYNNIAYTHLNSDLEFVVTLNSLLNKTGIIVSGFVGAGLAYNNTKFDLRDSITGAPYDYSVINSSGTDSRRKIYRDLKALSDTKFETNGINYLSISPTAGFFLGYQFSKSFSMGIEHKMNFFLSENNTITGANIDGNINAGSAYDRNNYTSLQLKWDIRKKSSTPSLPNTGTNDNANDLIATPCNLPKINFTVTEKDSRFSSFELSGSIRGIDDRSAIRVLLNGVQDDSFQYLPGSNRINSIYQLGAGRQEFTIIARNECGEDRETFTLFMDDPQAPCIQPYIDFQVNEINQLNASHELIGSLEHVRNQSNILVEVDGRRDFNFQYNVRTKRLNSIYQLSPGRHVITISAKNECGEDSQSVTIFVRESQIPCELPNVNLQVNEVNAVNFSHELNASLSNIRDKSDITLKIDGRTDNNFQYDLRTKRLNANYRLNPGRHSIMLIASNECGEDSQIVNVYVNELTNPCQPPMINFRLTEVNTANASHELIGNITNINNRTDISIKLDGRTDNNFQFDLRNKQLRAVYKLSPGRHSITIKAKNECGEDMETRTINVSAPLAPCSAPQITLYVKEEPSPNATHRLTANITEVVNKSQISITVDGRLNNDFQFNLRAKQLSSTYMLSPGNHTIVVTAKNECGEDVKSTSVIVTAPEVPCVQPKVRLSIVEERFTNTSHKLSGTITQVASKSDITVQVDGRIDNSFKFNASNNRLLANYMLSPGNHVITVRARNECGEDVESISVLVTEPEAPCVAPKVSLNVIEQATGNFTHSLIATVTEVKTKSNITIKVDGRLNNNFQFDANTKMVKANYKLSTGRHNISLTAKNECGQDTKTTTVIVAAAEEEEEDCGVRINPGNADWQFCLITPRGTFNRANLANNNFTYSGSATSLYFKAIAGGGNVTVNGQPYTIRPGQFYLFTGQLNVTVSTKNPGSMGSWSVCIETNKTPSFGVGKSRPISPCETSDKSGRGTRDTSKN